MRASLVVSAIGMLLCAAPDAVNAAVIQTAVYAGHTYHLLDAKTWLEQEAEAMSLGGHLVTINDGTENTFLVGEFNLFQTNMWIGFTDRALEGTFAWTSGQAVTYTNWFSGEPNNQGGNEDYVDLNWFFSRWNDLSGDQQLLGIAEVEPIPEPASVTLVALGLGVLSRTRRR